MATTDQAASPTRTRRKKPRARKTLTPGRALLAHGALILLAVLMLYPVAWMVMASFRPQSEIFAGQGLIPRTWTLHNYVAGWRFFGSVTFSTFYINSFIICALAVVGNLMACSLAGYAFARLHFRLKWLWFSIMVGSIMLPIHAQLIPQYIA